MSVPALGRFALALAAIVTLTGAGLPYVRASWTVLANSTEPRTFQFRETTAENFARIIPDRLAKIAAPVSDEKGKPLIVADTLLVGTDGDERMLCELYRRVGNESFTCISDDDGDGRYESYARARIASDIFFALTYGFYKRGKLAQPVAATALDPRTNTPEIFVELFFENRAEWVGHNVLYVCIQRHGVKTLWGTEQPVRMCRQGEIDIKDADYPLSFPLYGGRVHFLSRNKDLIETRFEPPPRDIPL